MLTFVKGKAEDILVINTISISIQVTCCKDDPNTARVKEVNVVLDGQSAQRYCEVVTWEFWWMTC